MLRRQLLSRDNSSKEIRDEPGCVGVFCQENILVVRYQKITANHKTRHLKLIILVLLYVWEDARIWGHWNYSLDVHLNYLGSVSKAHKASCFSLSGIALGAYHQWEWGCCSGWWLGACLLEWQATSFVHRGEHYLSQSSLSQRLHSLLYSKH